MKRLVLFIFLLLPFVITLTAQQAQTGNPFAELGYKANVATFTSFEEFHDQKRVVEIGGVFFDTRTNEVVGYVDARDSLSGLAPDVISTSIDPFCEKYYSISPYAYCFNNPVKFVDPDGRDGIISITGSQVTIGANIFIYGSRATHEVAAIMQKDIENRWDKGHTVTRENGDKFNVGFDVNVSVYGGKENSNPVFIPGKYNPFNRDNYIELPDKVSKDRSFVQDGDQGLWRGYGRYGQSLQQDNPAAHEFGHLMGLGDRYKDATGKDKGWETNIMGNSHRGQSDTRNIEAIIQDAFKAYDEWIKDHSSKDVFKYEINLDKMVK